MSSRDWPIRVRIAQAEDRDAILAFARHTWNGWDYIPEVWDEWVVPSDGVVLVATVDPPLNGGVPLGADGTPLEVGQPIAMTRVVMLSETEAWLEGIRVDPHVRGLSVATDLQVAELRWIAAHGAGVVRYMTGETNVGSQRLGARHGLVEIGRWRWYGIQSDRDDTSAADPRDLEARLSALGKAGVDDWPRVRDDAALSAGHGLYEARPWAYQELTEERFRAHAHRGEVVTATTAQGSSLLIVNRAVLEDGRLHVTFAAGDGGAFVEMLRQLGRPSFRVPDPDPPLLRGHLESLAAAGYAPNDENAIVVERPIDAAHPLPQPEEARLLVYGEEPRPVAVARALPT